MNPNDARLESNIIVEVCCLVKIKQFIEKGRKLKFLLYRIYF
jgi:hypothetical protein